MKNKLLFVVLLIMAVTSVTIAQHNYKPIGNHYAVAMFQLPLIKTQIKDFAVSGYNEVFIPLNGGVVMPKDSSLVVPTSEERYVYAFCLNEYDTGCFVLTRGIKDCNIEYLRVRSGKKLQARRIAAFSQGVYSMLYKDRALYIWGYDGGKYRIGMVANNTIEWLGSFEEKVAAIDVDDDGRVMVAINNRIININDRATVVFADTTIAGFSYLENDCFIVSTKTGLYKVKGKDCETILTGIYGPVREKNGHVYILSHNPPLLCDIISH